MQPLILILGDAKAPTLSFIAAGLRSALPDTQIVELYGRDIVEHLQCDDHLPQMGKPTIRWQLNSHQFTSEQVRGAVNQLSDLHIGLFSSTDAIDREYSRSEFIAYMIFALNLFPNVINPAWGGSLSGFCQSLPYQWYLSSKKFALPICPDFYFGPSRELPSHLRYGKNIIISKNICDGRHWLTSKELPWGDEPILAYQRPRGLPVLVSMIDDLMFSYCLKTNEPFQINDIVREHGNFLREHFHLRMASALYFYDIKRQCVTFGSIQPGVRHDHMTADQQILFIRALASKFKS